MASIIYTGNEQPSLGANRILHERLRHAEKAYDADHDDHHQNGAMIYAAIAYLGKIDAFAAFDRRVMIGNDYADGAAFFTPPWPWAAEDNKSDQLTDLRLLEIAGSWIAAEIDRRLRALRPADDDKIRRKYNLSCNDIDRMVDDLRFYAEPTNWQLTNVEGQARSPVELDKGKAARRILAEFDL